MATCSKCEGVRDGVHGSYCRSCFAAYQRARYVPRVRKRPTEEEMREKKRVADLRWYHKHKDELSRRRIETLDGEIARQRQRERYRQNPEKAALHTRQRRTRRREGWVESVHPLVVLERDDGVCGICGRDVDPFRFHVDHIVPLSRGGEHSYANCQVAHPSCNRSKFTKLPDEVAA